ncbi:hypothetical protein ACQKNX_22680 [Lysinibacillus sp. NPDC093712]|uniref:hypothetical protein n=1 Tax=Lysinibacillus sp. NPDC093712 TaxID=3390579 RepID=UPI003D000368
MKLKIREILSTWNYFTVTREFIITAFIIISSFLSVPGVLMFIESIQFETEKEKIITAFANAVLVFALTFAATVKITINTRVNFSMLIILGAVVFLFGFFSYVSNNQTFIYLIITFCISYFGLYGIEIYRKKKLLVKDNEIVNKNIDG